MTEMCFHWVGGSVRHSWQGKTLIEQHAGQQKGCKMFNNKSRGNNNHLKQYMWAIKKLHALHEMPILLIGQLTAYINRVETMLEEISEDVKICGTSCSSD